MPARHRRTRPVAVAVLALGAGLGLSACGAPHAGSAAVVDGSRVTVTTVQHRVNELRAAVGTKVTVNLNEFTMNQIISEKVLDRALADHRITVSDADANQLHAQDTQAAGGEAKLRASLLQRSGVVPGQVDDFYRRQAGMRALIVSTGTSLTDGTAAQQALDSALTAAAKEMKISVNPRYGAWNPAKMTLTTAAEPWLQKPRKA